MYFDRFFEEIGISVCENKDLALQGSNGLVVMTEWGEFRSPSFAKIKGCLETPVIFDARNLFSTEKQNLKLPHLFPLVSLPVKNEVL